jgi:predicted nucleotidyltransferase
MSISDISLPIPIQELKSILRRNKVEHASVFGSVARNQSVGNSDLDLLVELEDGATYLDLGAANYELQDRYNVRADMATKLHPLFKPYIEKDLVSIF